MVCSYWCGCLCRLVVFGVWDLVGLFRYWCDTELVWLYTWLVGAGFCVWFGLRFSGLICCFGCCDVTVFALVVLFTLDSLGWSLICCACVFRLPLVGSLLIMLFYLSFNVVCVWWPFQFLVCAILVLCACCFVFACYWLLRLFVLSCWF